MLCHQWSPGLPCHHHQWESVRRSSSGSSANQEGGLASWPTMSMALAANRRNPIHVPSRGQGVWPSAPSSRSIDQRPSQLVIITHGSRSLVTAAAHRWAIQSRPIQLRRWFQREIQGHPCLTVAFDLGPRPRAAPFSLTPYQVNHLPRSRGWGEAGQRWR
jgi:hypothetical protein